MFELCFCIDLLSVPLLVSVEGQDDCRVPTENK